MPVKADIAMQFATLRASHPYNFGCLMAAFRSAMPMRPTLCATFSGGAMAVKNSVA